MSSEYLSGKGPDPEKKPMKPVTGTSGTVYETWTRITPDGDRIDVLETQGAPPEDLAHGG